VLVHLSAGRAWILGYGLMSLEDSRYKASKYLFSKAVPATMVAVHRIYPYVQVVSCRRILSRRENIIIIIPPAGCGVDSMRLDWTAC
jgi:hypothetical protein